ncbi:MAG TPA: hypothetical protein VGC90_05075 [Candidatus Limnocylindrales bacterium]
MIRGVIVAVLIASVAGCATAQPPTATPTAANHSIPVNAVDPTATDLPTPTPTPAPSPTATPPTGPLTWIELTGVDLRGAAIATGAVAGATTVLLGADVKTNALLSWTSTDGSHFERHWLDGATFGGGVPQAVIAGGPGFVAFGWDVDPDSGTHSTIWTSADGIEWARDADATSAFDGGAVATAASPSAIAASTCCTATGYPSIRASLDALTWRASTPPGAPREALLVAATGNQFLAIGDIQNETDGHPVYATWLSTDGTTWARNGAIDRSLVKLDSIETLVGTPEGFAVLDGSNGLHLITADGSLVNLKPPAESGIAVGGAAGLGWIAPSEDGGCAAAWHRVAGKWEAISHARSCSKRQQLDSTIALGDGWLVIDPSDPPGATKLWALRPAGAADSVAAPTGSIDAPASAIPAAPTGALSPHHQCPAGAVTPATLIALDPHDRAACYGSRPLTFRAWLADPGEGWGGICPEQAPAWLQLCVLAPWWLATGRSSKAHLDAVQSPGATGNLKGVGRWATVTGHFDDPASGSCRPVGITAVFEPPRAVFVLECREQFVVTRLDTSR